MRLSLPLLVLLAFARVPAAHATPAVGSDHACYSEYSTWQAAKSAVSTASSAVSTARTELSTRQDAMDAAYAAVNANPTPDNVNAYNAAKAARDAAQSALTSAENTLRSKRIARDRAEDSYLDCLKRSPASSGDLQQEGPASTGGGKRRR